MHLRYTQQTRNVTKEMGDLRTVTEAFLVHIMSDWKPDDHIITISILHKSFILSHFFLAPLHGKVEISLPVDPRSLIPHSTSVHTGGGKRLLLRTSSEFQFLMVFLFIPSNHSGRDLMGNSKSLHITRHLWEWRNHDFP